jgi:hypothetical protein
MALFGDSARFHSNVCLRQEAVVFSQVCTYLRFLLLQSWLSLTHIPLRAWGTHKIIVRACSRTPLKLLVRGAISQSKPITGGCNATCVSYIVLDSFAQTTHSLSFMFAYTEVGGISRHTPNGSRCVETAKRLQTGKPTADPSVGCAVSSSTDMRCLIRLDTWVHGVLRPSGIGVVGGNGGREMTGAHPQKPLQSFLEELCANK